MLRLHLGANLVGSTITTARMPRHKRRGHGRAHSLVLAPNGRKRIRQAYATIDGIGVSNNPKKMEPAVPPPTTAAVTTDRSITALRFRTRSRSFALVSVGIGRAASGQFSCSNSDTGSLLRYHSATFSAIKASSFVPLAAAN